MQQVVHVLRQIARQEAVQRNAAYLGVVSRCRAGRTTIPARSSFARARSCCRMCRLPSASWVSPCLPAEGDLVVVLFLGGDLHAPIVVGRLYTQDLQPPQHDPRELVMQLPVDADADKRIDLRINTPDDGSRKLSLVLDGDVSVSIDVRTTGSP